MSKEYKIHWRKNDTAEINRLTRNFNAKIRRLEKNHPELTGNIPERVKAKDLIQGIETRAELNVLKRSLSAFTKKGSEKLVESPTRGTTTKWQAHEDKLLINRTISKFNKKLDKVATIENIDYLPQKLDKSVKQDIKTPEDFKHFVERHTRFLNEGAENIITSSRGAKASQWEVDEFYINQERENEKRRKTKEELGSEEVTIANKGTGVTRAEMGKIKENEVVDSQRNFDNMSMKEWKNISNLFEKKMLSSYSDKMKLNKLTHYCLGLENQGLGDIVEIMKKIPLDDFIKYLDTDEVAEFGFIYDPQSLETRREYITEFWKQHVDPDTNHIIEYYGSGENGKQSKEILLRL